MMRIAATSKIYGEGGWWTEAVGDDTLVHFTEANGRREYVILIRRDRSIGRPLCDWGDGPFWGDEVEVTLKRNARMNNHLAILPWRYSPP